MADLCGCPNCLRRDRDQEGKRLITITVGGSSHTRTADEWLALARAGLKANAGVTAAPVPQPDESKLPPRPAGSNDSATDPASPLERWGRADAGTGLLLQRMADGYWTPWHIANEMLREAQRNAGVPASSSATLPPSPTDPKENQRG